MDYRLRALREYGTVKIGAVAGTELQDLIHYLTGCPVHIDAHVPQTARNRGEPDPVPRRAALHSECICVPTSNAIKAPWLLECALSLTDIVAAYLGRDPPVAYSANAFWTRPGGAAVRGDIQDFHRDYDDTHFVAMFVYLTDVLDAADGPQELRASDGVTRSMTGVAGTVFLSDTSLSHRGLKPIRGERGIAWVRWGVSDRPPANEWDKNEPISRGDFGEWRYPDEPRLRESIRLLVTP